MQPSKHLQNIWTFVYEDKKQTLFMPTILDGTKFCFVFLKDNIARTMFETSNPCDSSTCTSISFFKKLAVV